MQDAFDITSNQYSIIVLIFFVSYTIFEIPSNMILVRVKPSVYLSALAVLWGIVVCCMAATKNWRDVVGCRFVLGAVESGFAAGCAFYLSSWYRTHELAARYAIIYTSVALAGGLSGLLAGVITDHLDGAQGIAGWKWLFVSHKICFSSTMFAHLTPSRSLKAPSRASQESWSFSSCPTTHLLPPSS